MYILIYDSSWKIVLQCFLLFFSYSILYKYKFGRVIYLRGHLKFLKVRATIDRFFKCQFFTLRRSLSIQSSWIDENYSCEYQLLTRHLLGKADYWNQHFSYIEYQNELKNFSCIKFQWLENIRFFQIDFFQLLNFHTCDIDQY